MIEEDEERQHTEQLLHALRRRLRALELSQANYGSNTPPHILIEIEDINKDIEQIRARLEDSSTELVPYSHSEQEFVEEQMKTQKPPESVEYMLWYLPKDIREAVIGDLEGEFHIIYDRFGRKKAIIWYYYQVGASFWPFAVSKLQKIIKLGVLGWVTDLFRRLIT